MLSTSYKKVASALRRACTCLGVEPISTTHSLRRGGATEMLVQQVPILNIMEFGRWASESSARLYLRRGEVALLRCRGNFSEQVQSRLCLLAQIGAEVWRLCKLV